MPSVSDSSTGYDFDRLDQLFGSEDYRTFLKDAALRAGSRYIASISLPINALDPLACLEILSGPDSFRFYWEHPEQELAFAAGEAVVSMKGSGKSRFEDIQDHLDYWKEHSLSFSPVPHSLDGIHAFGGFSFFDRIDSDTWEGFNPAGFAIPGWIVVKHGKLGIITLVITLDGDHSEETVHAAFVERYSRFRQMFELYDHALLENQGGTFFVPGISEKENGEWKQRWIDTVAGATRLIREKAFEKIVVARAIDLEGDQKISPTLLLHKLRNRYPSCYSFMIQFERSAVFIGSSPERLAAFQYKLLVTEGLAGSIPRGNSATDDAVLEKQLLRSAKDKSEHDFVVKAVEEYLKPFVRKIERPDLPGIKKLNNVQHLFTPITAWLKENSDRISIIKRLHPTPAVGGFPRDKAVPYIKQLEQFDRGWYAGPVGWINFKGSGEFSVAIRSGLVFDRAVRFFAGCGIVEDSDPLAEWEETNLKFTPLLSALGGND